MLRSSQGSTMKTENLGSLDGNFEIIGMIQSCNGVLMKWHQKFPLMTYRSFCHSIFGGNFDFVPERLKSSFMKDLPIMLSLKNKPLQSFDGLTVEQVLLDMVTPMVKKHVKKWANSLRESFDIDDLCQECYLRVIDSVYYWKAEPNNVKLITYLWAALSKHLCSLIKKNSMFCSLTNQDMQLKMEYRKALEANPRANFEEITEQLELSDKQIKRLNRILPKIVTQSSLEHSENLKISDYTELRKDLNETNENETQSINIEFLCQKAQLSSIEEQVLKLSLNDGSYGWQNKFAQTTLNPKTNKPYSRMQITHCLQSARKKIAQAI